MNWSELRILTVCLALLPASLFAQDAVPTPTPAPIIANPESAGSKKISFLRVWYFGAPKSKRITLLCQQGTGDPIVLGSYVRAGDVKNYRPFKPGNYVLSTVDGSVVPDANGKVASGSPPISKNVTLDVKPGTFSTVIVREKEGNFSTEVIEDKIPENSAGPSIRTFDFTGSPDVSVRLINGEKKLELWNASMANPLISSVSIAPGSCRFEFCRTIDGQRRCLAGYERDLKAKSSYSVVIYTDRYGEPAFAVTEDQAASVSAEEMKELTQSAAAAQ